MKFIRTEIEDVVVVEPKVWGDERGYFVETFRKDLFEDFLGFEVGFCQDNESKSKRAVLRGLHYQLPPFAQSKLVRVIEGSVLDVAVDIRKGSPTFGKYVAVELSGENKRQLFVPRGFAHAFVVTSETAIFAYKVDNYYAPEYDRGIRFDDPDISLKLPFGADELLVSPKDAALPSLQDADLFDYNDELYGDSK
jgi:dTDP-4-dehydrorhamnose 3,5-epimerase